MDGPGPADLAVAAAEDPENIGYDRGRVYVFANSSEPTGVREPSASGLSFLGAGPNPSSSEVRLELALDHAARVRVMVFDLAGHEIARPIADEWLLGRVSRVWRPRGLPSGIYYVRAELDGRVQVRKLVWLGRSR